MPDKFVDLSSYTKDNDWVAWKSESATVDGKLIGAGTDIGPEGICYRADLLEKAGFPSDRESVAEWLGGDDATWDSFFKAGKEYTEKTGLPWYDSMASNWQSMINQVEESYVFKDDKIIAADNAKIKDLYDQLTATKDMSAHLTQWSDDWNAAFKSDTGFATIQCPAWLINNIKATPVRISKAGISPTSSRVVAVIGAAPIWSFRNPPRSRTRPPSSWHG